MNHTQNYQLSQWDAEDKVQRVDFNADNAKIDAALRAQADVLTGKADSSTVSSLQGSVSSLSTALGKKGNCSVGAFTYTGTGTYGQDNPTQITFPKRPIMYVILGGDLMIGSATQAIHTYAISGAYVVGGIGTAWSGNTVSFWNPNSSERQMNRSGASYQVIAFYAQ